MTARPGVLALAAVIVVGVATVVAGTDQATAPIPPASTIVPAPPPEAEVARPATADPVLATARTYALTARNWTAASYRRVWRRELALTAGAYRRQLRAARPTPRQLAALKTDAATSRATVTRTQRDARVPAPRARVLIWLAERTNVAGQTITGATRNEVRLRRAGREWRVTAWTALPGPEAAP
jgi:hypothetical protein